MVDFSIPFLRTHKCLIIASTDPASLTTTTTTTTTETPTAVTEDETLLATTTTESPDDEAVVLENDVARRRRRDVGDAQHRRKRQLSPVMSQIKLGGGTVQKHQYDVKGIANDGNGGKI